MFNIEGVGMLIFDESGMPILTGFEAARAMRQQPWGKDIVLVALTGWGQYQDRANGHARLVAIALKKLPSRQIA